MGSFSQISYVLFSWLHNDDCILNEATVVSVLMVKGVNNYGFNTFLGSKSTSE